MVCSACCCACECDVVNVSHRVATLYKMRCCCSLPSRLYSRRVRFGKPRAVQFGRCREQFLTGRRRKHRLKRHQIVQTSDDLSALQRCGCLVRKFRRTVGMGSAMCAATIHDGEDPWFRLIARDGSHVAYAPLGEERDLLRCILGLSRRSRMPSPKVEAQHESSLRLACVLLLSRLMTQTLPVNDESATERPCPGASNSNCHKIFCSD